MKNDGKDKLQPVREIINSLQQQIKKLGNLGPKLEKKEKELKEFEKTLENQVDTRTSAERTIQKQLRNEIEHRKRLEQVIQDALEYANGIINTVRDPLIILDADLKVISASRSFYHVFKVKPEDTEKQNIYDLGNHQWNIPKLRELLEDILPHATSFDNFEVEHNFPDIGKRIMLLNARKIYSKVNQLQFILLAIEDITPRKKAEELLKEAAERKSVFVANVSHEFKNPLFIIKESLSIILEGVVGEINEKQKKILEGGKSTVERLLRLVINLLDVSKIEAGKMEMKREKIDMPLLINKVAEEYKAESLKKELIIEKEFSRDFGYLWGDKDKLEEVIINLLSNALKYTPAGGKVAIKLQKTGEVMRFEIFNSGSGLSSKDINELFDKFERLTAEKEEGTGLGLPIAKDIIELHKGKIWVESEMEKGVKFIFTLPIDLRK